MLQLPADEVHLWHLAIDELPAGFLEQVRTTLLSDDEAARCERYRHEGARQMFLAARWLVRTTLSRYAAVAPTDWRFAINGHGRPEVAVPGLETLRFNLSHSAGVLLLGVVRQRDIGVDVEHVTDQRDLLGIAQHSFAPAEIEQLEAAPLPQRAERFFAIWTLKEAYIKARGMGLAFPLDRFALGKSGPVTSFAVAAELDPAPADWQLHDWRLKSSHHAAVFVRGRGLPLWLHRAWQPEAAPQRLV